VLGVRYGGLLGVVVAHITIAGLTTCWYFPWSLYRHANFNRIELRELSIELGRAMLCALICGAVFNLVEPIGWIAFTGLALAFVASYFGMLGSLSRQARQEIVLCIQWGLSRLKNSNKK